MTARHARLRAASGGLVLLALLALPDVAAAQSFDIADVMSAPFPDGLVAASDADVIAWTSNDEGARNVWVARGPEWIGGQITSWEGDSGQEVTGLQLAPDGSWILYTRGGSGGWTPAPALDVEGAERTRWLHDLSVEDAEPVEIDRWGTLSPDGSMIAWTQGGSILVAPFTGAEPDDEGATTIATPRSGAGSLTWSPDGTRIAFVSNRDAHSFIGIAEVDGSGFRFPAPHVTEDRAPVWSPDGTRIAFLRWWAPEPVLPFVPQPAWDLPWQVVVMEVESGETEVVFEADPGRGSRFTGVTADRDLWWTRDDRLVFPWEGEGWKRLWSVAPDGSELRLLTPGEHVIQHAALAPDGRTIVFDSNRDDIDRKHIWSVRGDGSDLRQWTPGTGIEWAPVPLASGGVAFLGSGATMPARPFVMEAPDADRITPAGAVPASFPADELVVPEAVTFRATDGLEIHGQLFLPPDLREGERRPALLFFHGGSRRQMLLGFHNRGYYHNAYAMNQWLASAGYVVLAVNYRSGVGYGLDFREADEYGATGASEVRDVIGAALWIRGRDDVDPDRVGLWGGSYGGFLTAQGLVHAPDLFAAGVDFHGVHDWNVGIGNFRSNYEPENVPEFAELAFASSPLSRVDEWEDPVLLIHADDDRNVRFFETITLAKELTLRDVHVETLVFPDDVHGFLLHRNWITAYRATLDFFERMLR